MNWLLLANQFMYQSISERSKITMSKTTNAKLFGETVTQKSALEYLRESLEFGLNENGQTIVQFALCGGKGTSKQEIPVEEFTSFVTEFRRLSAEGIDRVETARNAVDQLKQSVALNDDGRVQFRIGVGKGVKPTNFDPAEFSQIAEMFEAADKMLQKKLNSKK